MNFINSPSYDADYECPIKALLKQMFRPSIEEKAAAAIGVNECFVQTYPKVLIYMGSLLYIKVGEFSAALSRAAIVDFWQERQQQSHIPGVRHGCCHISIPKI